MNNKSTFWKDLKSGHFVSMVKEASQGQTLCNSQQVFNVMTPMFAENDDVECVYCIFLNAKNRILAIEKVFSGSISASAIYPRELVKRILALKSTAIVMVHNHPSGCVEPSNEDENITAKVAIALFSMDATLHDHIIIGGDGFHSMADTGFLKTVKSKFNNLLSL